MIEDCFMSWYENTFPNLEPSVDDCYWSTRAAYYAGWHKHRQVDEAVSEMIRLGEEIELD